MAKVANAGTVILLAKKAMRRGNRTLGTNELATLDGEGVNHVVEHIGFGDGLVRTVWALKVVGRDDPVEGTIDVTSDDFDELEEA